MAPAARFPGAVRGARRRPVRGDGGIRALVPRVPSPARGTRLDRRCAGPVARARAGRGAGTRIDRLRPAHATAGIPAAEMGRRRPGSAAREGAGRRRPVLAHAMPRSRRRDRRGGALGGRAPGRGARAPGRDRRAGPGPPSRRGAPDHRARRRAGDRAERRARARVTGVRTGRRATAGRAAGRGRGAGPARRIRASTRPAGTEPVAAQPVRRRSGGGRRGPRAPRRATASLREPRARAGGVRAHGGRTRLSAAGGHARGRPRRDVRLVRERFSK